MRVLGALTTLALGLAGLLCLALAAALLRAPARLAPPLREALSAGVSQLDQADLQLAGAERGVAAGLAALPQVAATLDQAARITAQAAVVLESAERSGHALAQGGSSLGYEVRKLLIRGKIRNNTLRLQAGIDASRETLAQLHALQQQVRPLEAQLGALAGQVREVAEALRPTTAALPRGRAALGELRGRAAPELWLEAVALLSRLAAALAALAGLTLLALAGTRARVARLERAQRAAPPPQP